MERWRRSVSINATSLQIGLNARAISSLQSELGKIETDVSRLIREMERSIKEADQFISTLKAAE